jgi:hypothetical protein
MVIADGADYLLPIFQDRKTGKRQSTMFSG